MCFNPNLLNLIQINCKYAKSMRMQIILENLENSVLSTKTKINL